MTDDSGPWFFFNGERLFRYATEDEARAHAAICLEKDRGAAVYDGYWMAEDLTQTICWGHICQYAEAVATGGDPSTEFILADAAVPCELARVREALGLIQADIDRIKADVAVPFSFTNNPEMPLAVARYEGLVFARDLILAALTPPEPPMEHNS